MIVLPRNHLIRDIDKKVLNKACVIAHLYYCDQFTTVFNYIKNIPNEIDVYIITDNKELEKIANESIIRLNKNNYKIIYKINKGRDYAALFVTANEIIKDYEYICFIHDKKGNVLGFNNYAYDWQYTFFESLLASKEYIANIINTFEQNNEIGILSSPVPLNDFFLTFKGYTWTGNIDKSKELLSKLKVDFSNVNLKEDPITIGSAFWFRRKALQKIIDYGFNYDDFPDEPMAPDYTIAHAFERILEAVSNSENYKCSYVINNEYAGSFMEDYDKYLWTLLDIIKEDHILKYNGSIIDFKKTKESLITDKKKEVESFEKRYLLMDNCDDININKYMNILTRSNNLIDAVIDVNNCSIDDFSNNNYYFCEDSKSILDLLKQKRIENYKVLHIEK